MTAADPGTTIGRIAALELAVVGLIGDVSGLQARLIALENPPKRDPAPASTERTVPMDQDAVWRQAAAAVLAERERIRQLAESLKFRLYRPGNGPGAGTHPLDVIPLGELLAALRQDDGYTGGATLDEGYRDEKWQDAQS